MKVVISDPESPLAGPLIAALGDARWETTSLRGANPQAAPPEEDDVDAALSGADVLFFLDLRKRGHPDRRLARINRLIDAASRAGLRRIVLLSETSPDAPAGTDAPPPDHIRVARAAEAALAARPAKGLEWVVIRAPDLHDPEDPETLAPLRRIMLEGESGAGAAPFQRVHPLDLCAALLAAARSEAAAGQVFNIADAVALSPAVLAAEMQRLGRLLTNPGAADDRVRPDYPVDPPVIATEKAARLLGFRPARTVWIGLAECAQAIVAGLRAEGRIPENAPRLPAVARALEMRETPLQGKVCVVTGATSGIGRTLAVILSRCGARVVALGRNRAAGAALMDELETRPGCTRGEFHAADFTSMREVRALADRIGGEHARIDALINNAGAVFATRQMTGEQIEATFAVNYLAPFLLTTALLGRIPGGGDIVTVSCDTHRTSGLDFDDLFCARDYAPLDAYARAKFTGMMFTRVLAGRVGPDGPRVTAISPGMVRTGIFAHDGLQSLPEVAAMDRFRNRLISPERAAMFVAALLVDPALRARRDTYIVQDAAGQVVPPVDDPRAGAHLWRTSEALLDSALAAHRPQAVQPI